MMPEKKKNSKKSENTKNEKDTGNNTQEKENTEINENAETCSEENISKEKEQEKCECVSLKEYSELKDKFLHLAADFDNFKKRSNADKLALKDVVVSDTVQVLLPVIDNLERALEAAKEPSPLKEGVQMVLNQAKNSFDSLGIKQFGERGEEFNPEIHNAVMTCEDEELETNMIAEVLQKGYKIGDKIIRHALVKVVS